jgi:hypothetical protein
MCAHAGVDVSVGVVFWIWQEYERCCVYVCMCMRMCVCACMCMCMDTCVYVCVYVYVSACMYVYAYVCVRLYVYVYVCALVCVCGCVCALVCVCVCVCLGRRSAPFALPLTPALSPPSLFLVPCSDPPPPCPTRCFTHAQLAHAFSGCDTGKQCHKHCLHAFNFCVKKKFEVFQADTGYKGPEPDVRTAARALCVGGGGGGWGGGGSPDPRLPM